MNNLKKLVLSSALVLSGAANAGVITAAGGVQWDNSGTFNNGGNFFTQVKFRQWWEDQSGAVSLSDFDINNLGQYELTGIGEMVLGTDIGQPNFGSYELTFSFHDIFLDPNSPTGFNLDNARLDVYLDTDFSDNAGGFDVGQSVVNDTLDADHAADAVDGVLWLGLDFEAIKYSPDDTNALNPLFGNLLDGDTDFAFQIADVNPGIATANFESDWTTYLDELVDVIGFGLSSEFSTNLIDDIPYANVYSDSSAGVVEAYTVPEPSTLAIFGVIILGLAGIARARKIN